MKIRSFSAELWLPYRRSEVFSFFSNARNLGSITPEWLHFKFLTPEDVEMREGTLIDYRIRLHGIPIRWQTKITSWDPPSGFVDEQIRGPYRKWVHTHTFEEVDGGTLCRDAVEYAVPGGGLVHALLVRPDIERIFAFREKALKEQFPSAA